MQTSLDALTAPAGLLAVRTVADGEIPPAARLAHAHAVIDRLLAEGPAAGCAIMASPRRPSDGGDLAARQRELADRNSALLAQADAEGRDFAPDEAQEVERNLAEIDRLEVQARQREADERDAMTVGPSVGRRTAPTPIDGAGGPGGHLPAAGRFGGNDPALPRVILPGQPRTFAHLFPETARDTRGWRSNGEFLSVVARRVYDPRLTVRDAQVEGVGEAGGWLVPAPILAGVLDSSLEGEIVRPRARVVPMGSATLALPVRDTLDRSTGKLAGLRGQWLGEGQPGDYQQVTFRRVTITAHKLAIFAQASSELAEDAPGLDAELTAAFTESAGYNMDEAFLRGSGVAQPLGVLSAPNLIVADAEAGQAADTITLGNLATMWSRLLPASARTAVWLLHPSALAQLVTMPSTIVDRATGAMGGAPMMQLNADGSYSILGRPVIVSELCSDLGDLGDVILADFSRYVIGLRRVARIEVSNAPGWTSDMLDFRMTLRVEGLPMDPAPVQPRNGAATLSPFVTLAAR